MKKKGSGSRRSPGKSDLTEAQRRTQKAVETFIAGHGYPPTIQELADLLELGTTTVFEQVNILTSGGPMNATTTIMHQVYVRAFVEYKVGYASSITILLIVIVAVVTALNFRFGSRGQDLDLS